MEKSSLVMHSRHEEFERALRSMRDRLVGVSEEVTHTLGTAGWYADTAPAHLRAEARAAIADIAKTQEWLKGRIAFLPQDPQQRYDAMRDMLEVQFVALQKITSLVEQLIASRLPAPQPSPRAPLALPPPASLFPAPASPPQPANPPLAVDFAPAMAQGAVAPLFPMAPQHLSPHPPAQAGHPQRHAHPSGQAPGQPPGQAPGQAWPAAWPDAYPDAYPETYPEARGAADPHGHPAPLRLSDLDAPSTRPPTDLPRAITGRRNAAPKGKAKEKAPARAAWPFGRRGLITAALLAAIVAVGIAGYFALTSRAHPQRVAIGDPAARNLSARRTGPAPVRSTDPVANRVPSAPPMSAPPLADPNAANAPASANPALEGGGFVPVIATHRDKQALSELYAQLRRQHPSIVAARQAQAQTVNLGSQGVWHQLILMPPAPRPEAEAICDALRRDGYPRCVVRTFRRP